MDEKSPLKMESDNFVGVLVAIVVVVLTIGKTVALSICLKLKSRFSSDIYFIPTKKGLQELYPPNGVV